MFTVFPCDSPVPVSLSPSTLIFYVKVISCPSGVAALPDHLPFRSANTAAMQMAKLQINAAVIDSFLFIVYPVFRFIYDTASSVYLACNRIVLLLLVAFKGCMKPLSVKVDIQTNRISLRIVFAGVRHYNPIGISNFKGKIISF